MSDDDALKEIQKAIGGLTYPSESDEPFQAFVLEDGKGDLADRLKRFVGVSAEIRVGEISVQQFFDELKDEERNEQFSKLRETLEKHLREVRVIRLGKVTVDVLVTGKTATGTYAGVRTKSVETG